MLFIILVIIVSPCNLVMDNAANWSVLQQHDKKTYKCMVQDVAQTICDIFANTAYLCGLTTRSVIKEPIEVRRTC